MKKSNKLIFLFIIITLFFAKFAFADLGISPSDWTISDGMPGQQIQKTFYLSRSDAKSDISFTSQISGELTSWIKIDNGDTFTIPKGKQQYPVSITLSVPQNAEKREYKGEIRLSSISSGTESGQIGVLLAALIRIDLTVTDKLSLDYSVQQIEIPKQEAGGYVNVILSINNQGNAPAKPTKVAIDFFDKYYVTKISSQTMTDFSGVQGVAPFSLGQVALKFPLQLTPEQYWADVTVYQNQKILKKEHLTFEITKAGTLENGVPTSETKTNVWLFVGIILAILVIVISIIFKVKGKRVNIN